MKKRGQVTIFIILAIIIVAAILVYFLWAQPQYFSERSRRVGFEGCIQDALEDKIEELGLSGGIQNPQFTYINQDQEFPYYCYTNQYYSLCTVQVAFPESTFNKELQSTLRNDIDECYSNSINELRAQGYDVSSGTVKYEVIFEPGRVRVALDAPTTVGSQTFTKFNVMLPSSIYEMTMIATSLLQYEATVGDTDTNAMSIYYPEYLITKNKMGDGTTLYEIESKIFGNKLRFASRSLVFPAGY